MIFRLQYISQLRKKKKKLAQLWKIYYSIIPPLLPLFLPLSTFIHSSHISNSAFDIEVGWRLKSGWGVKLWGMGQPGTWPQLLDGAWSTELFALCRPTVSFVLVTEDGWEIKEGFCFLSSALTYSTLFDISTSVFHSRHIQSSKSLHYPFTSCALISLGGFKSLCLGAMWPYRTVKARQAVVKLPFEPPPCSLFLNLLTSISPPTKHLLVKSHQTITASSLPAVHFLWPTMT